MEVFGAWSCPVTLDRFELTHPSGVTRHLYGADALAAGVEELGERVTGRTVLAVTARPILDLHAEALAPLREAAASVELIEVPDGEAAKTVGEAERLWRAWLERGGKRDSLVAAFGGGSVSDLAGFAAGAFLRGVPWIAIPTTLLAQVDAAVGGKTAVDLPEAKNSVGLFHHPLAVLADPNLLATLSRDQIRSGLVEVVKVGAILDPALFASVEGDLDALLAGDAERLASTVAAAARVKGRLVESDPEEVGARKLLNFGHTLGHAIEAAAGYGTLQHGDAVAFGLRFALQLSVRHGGDPEFSARVLRLLDRLGGPELPELEAEDLLARMGRDKKMRRSGIDWILLAGAGQGRVEREGCTDELRAALSDFLHSAGKPPV